MKERSKSKVGIRLLPWEKKYQHTLHEFSVKKDNKEVNILKPCNRENKILQRSLYSTTSLSPKPCLIKISSDTVKSGSETKFAKISSDGPNVKSDSEPKFASTILSENAAAGDFKFASAELVRSTISLNSLDLKQSSVTDFDLDKMGNKSHIDIKQLRVDRELSFESRIFHDNRITERLKLFDSLFDVPTPRFELKALKNDDEKDHTSFKRLFIDKNKTPFEIGSLYYKPHDLDLLFSWNKNEVSIR